MKIFILASLTIALIACAVSGQSEIDWCAVKATYCGTVNHIACLPNAFPVKASTCTNVVPYAMTDSLKTSILTKHNTYRNQVASGSRSPFPGAQKIGVMTWDNNLQYLAEKHAAYCSMEHDKCRATPAYPYSGQNIANLMTTGTVNVPTFTGIMVDNWFNEINVANVSLVDKFEMNHLNAAGHFSVMVNDKNSKVGCALITFKINYSGTNYNGIQMTCNYQYTNMLGDPTYVQGPACSSCSTCSATYPALCA